MSVSTVEISFNANHTESEAAVGKTLAEIRAQYAPIWNIPVNASVSVNGNGAEGAQVLYPGDSVDFAKATSEKGQR